MSGYSGTSSSNGLNSSISNSNYGQNVWSGQSNALQSLYNAANNLFNNSVSGISGQTNNAVNSANAVTNSTINALNSQLNGGAYSSIDANRLQNNIYDSMNTPSYTQQVYNQILGGSGNTYGSQLANTLQTQANRSYNNTLNSIDQRAAGSGMGGSSRQGIAQGIAAHDINNDLLSNLAQVGYDSYNTDLSNKLAIANQADTNSVSRQTLLSNLLSNRQNASTNALSSAGSVQNLASGGSNQYLTPFSALSQYASTIGSPTTLSSGTSSGLSNGYTVASGNSSGGGVCFITTAIVDALGEADDGPTLTKLRKFRDEHMHETEERQKALETYYMEAPSIVERLSKRPDAVDFYTNLYELFLAPAIEAIDMGDSELAFQIYKKMFMYCAVQSKGY